MQWRYLKPLKKKLEDMHLFIVSKLVEHYVKSVRIQCYSGPHFSRIFPHSDWIRKDGVSLRIQSECGKMRTRITPNTDTLHAVRMVMWGHMTDWKQYISLIKIPMVTCQGCHPSINSNDSSMLWSCKVTWHIKNISPFVEDSCTPN